jgi:hypothetical protein
LHGSLKKAVKNHTDAKAFIEKSPGGQDDGYYDEELEGEEEKAGQIDYDELYRKSIVLHSRSGKRGELDGRILKTTQEIGNDLEASE